MPALTICPEADTKWIGITKIMGELDKSGKVFSIFKDLPHEGKRALARLAMRLAKSRKAELGMGIPKWVKDLRKLAKSNENVGKILTNFDELLNGKKDESAG